MFDQVRQVNFNVQRLYKIEIRYDLNQIGVLKTSRQNVESRKLQKVLENKLIGREYT